jgi:hypothetical protein
MSGILQIDRKEPWGVWSVLKGAKENEVVTAQRPSERPGPGKALAIWTGAGIAGWGVVILAIWLVF